MIRTRRTLFTLCLIVILAKMSFVRADSIADQVILVEKWMRDQKYEEVANVLLKNSKNRKMSSVKKTFFIHMCQQSVKQRKWSSVVAWCRMDGSHEARLIIERVKGLYAEAYAAESIAPMQAIDQYNQILLMRHMAGDYLNKSISRMRRLLSL